LVGGTAEAIDLEIGDLAVINERERGRFFRALLLEFGGVDALQSNSMLSALFGVPERDRVGALQAQEIDEAVCKVGAADAPHPRRLYVAVCRHGGEHRLYNLVGGQTVDGPNLLARQRALG